MPTVSELLARFSSLAAMPAVLAITLTTTLLIVSREWRLNLFALALQYFFVVLLFTRVTRPEVAAVKGLIGWISCMVLYMTERRARPTRREALATLPRRVRQWRVVARASFALLSALMIAVAAYTAGLRFPLPVVPEDISLACYLLAGMGLLLVGLNDAPFPVGLGLLTFLSGFELFYVALEPSLAVTALLGALNFLIVLAVVYLRAAEIAVDERSSTL